MTVPTQGASASRRSLLAPPTWVPIVEFICLLFVLIEIDVVRTGGFRLRNLAGLRLSVTSPVRVLLWGIVFGLIRYFGARTIPIQLPRLIAAWWRSRPDVRSAFTVVVGTRPAILFVGYLAVIMLGYAPGAPPLRFSSSEIINLPVRWDTGWYLGIATDGYSFDAQHPEIQQNIVFFPAYPVILRAVGDFLGGTLTSDILAGTLVSLVAFFCALVYLYALARETLDDEGARDTLWLIAAYPFAVFFGAIYTESLFLLGAIGTFYHFKRGEFGRAAIWGLIVGLTRPPGCLISIPLAILAVEPWLRSLGVRTSGQPQAGPTWKALLTAATPGIGMLMYAAFIWHLTGNPLAWISGHAAWGRSYSGLMVLAIHHYQYIANSGFTGYVNQAPLDLLNALGAVFVLAAAWPVARRLGLAYAVFILVSILPPLADGGLLSAGRFSAVLFPAFIWLSGAVPRAQRPGWIATFAAVQALVAALFYTWRELY
jgi:hypothetical protein